MNKCPKCGQIYTNQDFHEADDIKNLQNENLYFFVCKNCNHTEYVEIINDTTPLQRFISAIKNFFIGQ